MITALPLFQVLALSGYVTIDGVAAGAADSQVTVEVKTSAPVETGDIRSKFAGGMMQLYLDGGHARGDRRAFQSGGLEASVLKRTGYAKVEVPLAAELGCVGPVTVAAGQKGFTASIKCTGAEVPAPSPSPKLEAAETAVKAETPTATPTEVKTPPKAEPVKAEP